MVKDVHTSFLEIYPSDTKAADQVLLSLQHFLGNTQVKTFYFDNARDLIKAVQVLGFGGTMSSPNQACSKQTELLNERFKRSCPALGPSSYRQAYRGAFGARRQYAIACSTTHGFLISTVCKRATPQMARTSLRSNIPRTRWWGRKFRRTLGRKDTGPTSPVNAYPLGAVSVSSQP